MAQAQPDVRRQLQATLDQWVLRVHRAVGTVVDIAQMQGKVEKKEANAGKARQPWWQVPLDLWDRRRMRRRREEAVHSAAGEWPRLAPDTPEVRHLPNRAPRREEKAPPDWRRLQTMAMVPQEPVSQYDSPGAVSRELLPGGLGREPWKTSSSPDIVGGLHLGRTTLAPPLLRMREGGGLDLAPEGWLAESGPALVSCLDMNRETVGAGSSPGRFKLPQQDADTAEVLQAQSSGRGGGARRGEGHRHGEEEGSRTRAGSHEEGASPSSSGGLSTPARRHRRRLMKPWRQGTQVGSEGGGLQSVGDKAPPKCREALDPVSLPRERKMCVNSNLHYDSNSGEPQTSIVAHGHNGVGTWAVRAERRHPYYRRGRASPFPALYLRHLCLSLATLRRPLHASPHHILFYEYNGDKRCHMGCAELALRDRRWHAKATCAAWPQKWLRLRLDFPNGQLDVGTVSGVVGSVYKQLWGGLVQVTKTSQDVVFSWEMTHKHFLRLRKTAAMKSGASSTEIAQPLWWRQTAIMKKPLCEIRFLQTKDSQSAAVMLEMSVEPVDLLRASCGIRRSRQDTLLASLELGHASRTQILAGREEGLAVRLDLEAPVNNLRRASLRLEVNTCLEY